MKTKTLTHAQLFLTDRLIQEIFKQKSSVNADERFYDFIYRTRTHIEDVAYNFNNQKISEIVENTSSIFDKTDDKFEQMAGLVAILLLLLNNSDDPHISEIYKTMTIDISLELLDVV